MLPQPSQKYAFRISIALRIDTKMIPRACSYPTRTQHALWACEKWPKSTARVCINFDDERFWKKNHTPTTYLIEKNSFQYQTLNERHIFWNMYAIFDRTPFLQKKTKYAELAMGVLRRRSTTSAKNAMPEEKRAKENQSEDVPLHLLIESTLRARWFLTAFFFFRLFLARRRDAFARFLFFSLPLSLFLSSSLPFSFSLLRSFSIIWNPKLLF